MKGSLHAEKDTKAAKVAKAARTHTGIALRARLRRHVVAMFRLWQMAGC
jgi:hypothetical protein